MNNLGLKPAPADQAQRERALDPTHSILVQAPAGSGKTDLLTRRFLRLLAEVDDPRQVVAITFTNAAAAEMRHRILAELEKSSALAAPLGVDPFSMESLADRALARSNALGWKLLDLPAQLRICTIDSFCRDLALQQPLLTGLGGGLDIAEQPEQLYRRAARRSLEALDRAGVELRSALEALLLWRDNNWQEMENLLVQMLGQRDRWMHDFLLSQNSDWDALRHRLERPFGHAVQTALDGLEALLGQVPGACDEAHLLARFACAQSGGELHRDLAEMVDFPCGPFRTSDALEEARQAFLCLAKLVLTEAGTLRKQVTVANGFPADRKREKAQMIELIGRLRVVEGLESALAQVRDMPPARYIEDDWQIVRACFTLLRHAAGELQVVFAEAGAVDFIEVAQVAQRVLEGPDGLPTDAALAVSEGIRHLLVDEFQDTSRRQHRLLAGLVAAWPERPGRSCFAVGDPMQSIYFFRDADAELFSRVRSIGLEIPQDLPLPFHFTQLKANFRTAPALVDRLNQVLGQVFAVNDGSGVTFSAADPARESRNESTNEPRNEPGLPFVLHLDFVPQVRVTGTTDPDADSEKDTARARQVEEIVSLIQSHMKRVELARARGEKYRIAVLGRARSALTPIALALRGAGIPFRAVDLESLSARPEVLDALALARALLNPQDRLAWLGVLRAPWCALALDDLHLLTSADQPALLGRPIPELLAERLPLLSPVGQRAASRVLDAVAAFPALRSTHLAAPAGTWLQQIWLRLGGAACVDAGAQANIDLLWGCLDRLPDGVLDLLGPALNAALKKLTALPDPVASAEAGVQLMTIHKSKGLEFEVVLVPELQAGGGRSSGKLLSWLERGLAQPDDTGEITEFLVAPLQPKGADRGKAKEWVDRVYRQRESQEDRRILYVAATRAREELHLFARPVCKVENDDTVSLSKPTGSLLATAWPALSNEIEARFEQWKLARATTPADEGLLESLAASANLVVMPAPAKPTILQRLPEDFQAGQEAFPDPPESLGAPSSRLSPGKWLGILNLDPALSNSTDLYTRHEGGLLTRTLGAAVHALLEQLACLRQTRDWEAASLALQHRESGTAAQVRANGIPPAQAAQIAAQAMQMALAAAHDPIGQWILSPHAEAASEAGWAGVVEGSLRTVRVDRVFHAGLEPGSEGRQAWWIIDYKTAHAESLSPDSLKEMRPFFEPQLRAYGQILRNLHGPETVLHAGLYYPSMFVLDWWEL